MYVVIIKKIGIMNEGRERLEIGCDLTESANKLYLQIFMSCLIVLIGSKD